MVSSYHSTSGKKALSPAPGAEGPTLWYLPSVFGFTLVIVVLATTFSIHIKADDIWWHLKAGQFILDQFALPDLNIFSFTAPTHHWLPHEWLSEVIFYLIFRHLGHMGLIGWGIALNAIACALVYKLTLRYSRSPYLSSLITLLAALMMLGNFSLRPYLFGNLFFIVTLHAMEEPTAGGRLRPVWIFLLFSAWANFHGSFVIGLALILLYLAASLASQFRKSPRRLAGARSLLFDLLVATIACVFTPHHVYGLIFPFVYVKNAFSGEMNFLTNISEWQPAGFETPLGRMITFYILFCAFAVIGSGLGPAPIHLGLLVAFSFYAYTTIRNIPLLGIAATPVLARHLPHVFARTWRLSGARIPLAERLSRWYSQSVDVDRRSSTILLPAVLGVMLLVIFSLPPSSRFSYASLTGIHELADLSPQFYPKGLIEELRARGTNHRTFNYFNWGGALIWALYPQQRVFIDQRNDCYPISVFMDYFAVHELDRDWKNVLARWRIDQIAYPKNTMLAEKLKSEPDWKLVYEDEQAVLFVRPEADPAPDAAHPSAGQDSGRDHDPARYFLARS